MRIGAQVLTPGDASGALLVLEVPLSLWGGIDLRTSRIIDHTHPRNGIAIAGRILAMKGGRGSSSSASVLAEIARAGVAPAAILLARHDPILVMGALVAEYLYAARIPILIVAETDWHLLVDGRQARIEASDRDAGLFVEAA